MWCAKHCIWAAVSMGCQIWRACESHVAREGTLRSCKTLFLRRESVCSLPGSVLF